MKKTSKRVGQLRFPKAPAAIENKDLAKVIGGALVGDSVNPCVRGSIGPCIRVNINPCVRT